MLIGYIDRVDRHYLSGWAAETDHPDAPVEVSVEVDGHEWTRMVANDFREDLKTHGAYGDGRHGFTYLFDRPMSVMESYQVKLFGHHNGNMWPLAENRIAKISPIATHREPILVTASGRSGTTILMKHLRDSRSIVIPDKYPYELKLLTYYCKAFDILTAPGNHALSMRPDAIYLDPHRLGKNPFNHFDFEDVFSDTASVYDFFEKAAPPKIALAFKAIIEDFYDRLADRLGRPDSIYFAEKTDILHATRHFCRIAFRGTKEIILVRDPRDLYCSYRSFWKSRPEVTIDTLKNVSERMVSLAKSGDEPDRIFIRYEDLVLEKEKVLQKISIFLQLDHVIQADSTSEQALFTKHGTSDDASASVGRWRKDLKAEELQMFTGKFDEFLATFDYESVTTPSVTTPCVTTPSVQPATAE